MPRKKKVITNENVGNSNIIDVGLLYINRTSNGLPIAEKNMELPPNGTILLNKKDMELGSVKAYISVKALIVYDENKEKSQANEEEPKLVPIRKGPNPEYANKKFVSVNFPTSERGLGKNVDSYINPDCEGVMGLVREAQERTKVVSAYGDTVSPLTSIPNNAQADDDDDDDDEDIAPQLSSNPTYMDNKEAEGETTILIPHKGEFTEEITASEMVKRNTAKVNKIIKDMPVRKPKPIPPGSDKYPGAPAECKEWLNMPIYKKKFDTVRCTDKELLIKYATFETDKDCVVFLGTRIEELSEGENEN